MLFKGIITNNMTQRNYLINHPAVGKLERVEISKSMAIPLDPVAQIPGFQILGIVQNKISVLNLSENNFSEYQFQHLFNNYFLTEFCKLESLNLSGLSFLGTTSLSPLVALLETSLTLKNLSLNNCSLLDTPCSSLLQPWFSIPTRTGQLSLSGNHLVDPFCQVNIP
jgi:hypothetical protein